MTTNPDRFLSGQWVGAGEIVGRGLLRWLMPREKFKITTRFERVSETIWVVRDSLEFLRGGAMNRTMFLEQTGERRYHVTADDMPLGSEIKVTDQGYTYAPYYSWASLRGKRWFVRVREEGEFLADGAIAGHIRVSWHGIPIARNRLVLRRP